MSIEKTHKRTNNNSKKRYTPSTGKYQYKKFLSRPMKKRFHCILYHIQVPYSTVYGTHILHIFQCDNVLAAILCQFVLHKKWHHYNRTSLNRYANAMSYAVQWIWCCRCVSFYLDFTCLMIALFSRLFNTFDVDFFKLCSFVNADRVTETIKFRFAYKLNNSEISILYP